MKKLFSKGNFIMFIKFSCVGVLNTLIDYGVFFVLCDILKLNMVFSNITSYVLAATNSYLLNSGLVYKDKNFTFKKFLGFLSGNVFVLIISTLFIALLSNYIQIKTIAKLISAPITLVLNFLIQRFIIFKKSADKINDEM